MVRKVYTIKAETDADCLSWMKVNDTNMYIYIHAYVCIYVYGDNVCVCIVHVLRKA
jgi:hypothetical protein